MPTAKRLPAGPVQRFGKPVPRAMLTVGEVCAELQIAQSTFCEWRTKGTGPRWKGGAITELTIPIKRTPPRRLRTEEDAIGLVRRLAVHYPDAMIAGILNRQGRRTPAECHTPPAGSRA